VLKTNLGLSSKVHFATVVLAFHYNSVLTAISTQPSAQQKRGFHFSPAASPLQFFMASLPTCQHKLGYDFQNELTII
jgi:hypothetical protein